MHDKAYWTEKEKGARSAFNQTGNRSFEKAADRAAAKAKNLIERKVK